MIRMDGSMLEKLLSRFMAAGMKMREVKRLSPTSVSCAVSVNDYYRLVKLARKHRCRIHILEKHGGTFFYTRMRFRKVMLFGWIPLLAAIIFLSGRVWFINVNGCYRVDQGSVFETLESLNVKAGMASAGIDTKALARSIMMTSERIAWAGVSLRGVMLDVEIVEASMLPEEENDAQGAKSVYARVDGQIVSITPRLGKSAVKPGDIVAKGDLLIDGNLTSPNGTEYFVAARGEVLAKVIHTHTKLASEQSVEKAKLEAQASALEKVPRNARIIKLVSDVDRHDDGTATVSVIIEAIEDICVDGDIAPLLNPPKQD